MSGLQSSETNYSSNLSTIPKSSTAIFRDKGVFSAEFAPERILLREAELHQLERVMGDIYRKALPRQLLVVGSFGIGKTLTIKWLHQKLPEDARSKNLRLRSVYVNCKAHDTDTKIVKRLVDELSDLELDKGSRACEPFTMLERMCKKLDWVLVILDDVDNLLRRVHAAYEKLLFMPSRLIPNLHYTMITNDLDLPQWIIQNVPFAIQETLSHETITFPPYDAEQLKKILHDRAELGLTYGAYDEGALSYAAAISSAQDLGARGAIDLIRIAGEMAEEYALPKLTEEHAKNALPKLEKKKTLGLLRALSPIRIAIVAHVADRGRTQASNIIKSLEGMRAAGQHFQLGERLLTYHLSALRDMRVILTERRGKGRGRGVAHWIYLNPDMEPDLRWALKHLKEE
jgi:cell division control protein 6